MSEYTKPDMGEIRTFHFDNGISLYVRGNHKAPVATIQAWVRTGSIHEGSNLGCGLSHFLEHMLFQGSEKYSAEKMMQIIHESGGDMNAYTSFASTVYYIETLSDAAEKAVDILSDMIKAPLFEEKIFKTEKDVILRERSMGKDNPDRMMGETLWKTVFRHHPVRHPIIGYSEQISKVNRKMMTEYYKKRYTPGRIFFVISGDVNAEEIAAHLMKTVGKMSIGNLHDPAIPSEPEQKCLRDEIFHYNDPSARISFGYRVPDISSSDVPALDLLSSILGHSKSSRLIRNLRDRQQLALNIDSHSYSSVFDGIFSVSAACLPEKCEELKSAIFAEIDHVSNGITVTELEKVKQQLVTNLYRGLRSNSGIAQIIGNSVLTYGTPEYAYKYIQDISSVTNDDIIRVAEQYLDREKASVVEMLPEELKRRKSCSETKKELNETRPHLLEPSKDLRLIHIEDNSSPLIDLTIIFPGGGIYEDREVAGISRLTSKLLMTGTKSYTEEKFSELLDNNAVSLDISGGNNTVTLRMNCLKKNINAGLEAIRSLFSEPLFSEETLQREKLIAIESLKTRALAPLKAAEDKMCEILYGNHPYSIPTAGLQKSIEHLTVNTIKDFYSKTLLNKKECVFGIAGDISAKDAVKISKTIIESIPWCKTPENTLPSPPLFPEKPQRVSVPLPKEQTVVMLGLPGCRNTDQDRFAMDILQTALNGLSTRLFKSIRDDAGLAYYTGLYSSRGIHDGFIAFYAGIAPDTSQKVIDIINSEKKKLASKGLTKKEYTSALVRLKGENATQKLNPGSILFHCALSEFYGNGYMEPWDICDRLQENSLQEINRIIKKYISATNTVTVIAGA